MYYLKDIPDLDSHIDVQYLKDSCLWEMPLRFINEETFEEFCRKAKEDLSPERATNLANHIVTSVALSEFVGLIGPTKISNYLVN